MKKNKNKSLKESPSFELPKKRSELQTSNHTKDQRSDAEKGRNANPKGSER
ncbi:MAG TPA: hypothetical protein VGD40_12970 [Chryseosolibacter sp.]